MNEDLDYYDYIERVVLEDFLPTIVVMRKRWNGDTKKFEMQPSILYEDIVNLGLSERENEWLIDYLKNNNILIIRNGCVQDVNPKRINRFHLYSNSKDQDDLSKEETMEKFRFLSRNYDPQIREEIIVGNMRLVSYFAWIYSDKYRMDFYELQQYGYEGLIYAVDHFKLESGTPFAHYACLCIKGFIKKGCHQLLGVASSRNWSVHMLKAKKEVEKKHGVKIEDDPNLIKEVIDLMIEAGYGIEANRKLYERHMNILFNNTSLEDLLESGEDVLGNNELMSLAIVDIIRENLSKLSERQQLVIRLRFGLYGEVPKTLEEISQKMGVSRERVRQIESDAIKKIINYSKLTPEDGYPDEFYDNPLGPHPTTKK